MEVIDGESFSSRWHARQWMLARIYELASQGLRVEPDPWALTAMRAAARQRTHPLRPSLPPAPSADAMERYCRKVVVEELAHKAGALDAEIPPYVLDRLDEWKGA